MQDIALSKSKLDEQRSCHVCHNHRDQWIQNLLDAKNVISVYRATGNPDDDGYLTDAAAQNSINSKNDPDSFRYLYSLAVNNPSNYSLPRMWRAGISIDF